MANGDKAGIVLVVEDDELVRMGVIEEFEEQGFDVMGAVDALSALAIVESAIKVALLITDIGLPGLDGRQLAARVRAVRPEVAVLFLTGYAGGQSSEELPLTRLVEKPIELRALVTIARNMIAAS